jgi:hypothetical protein
LNLKNLSILSSAMADIPKRHRRYHHCSLGGVQGGEAFGDRLLENDK